MSYMSFWGHLRNPHQRNCGTIVHYKVHALRLTTNDGRHVSSVKSTKQKPSAMQLGWKLPSWNVRLSFQHDKDPKLALWKGIGVISHKGSASQQKTPSAEHPRIHQKNESPWGPQYYMLSGLSIKINLHSVHPRNTVPIPSALSCACWRSRPCWIDTSWSLTAGVLSSSFRRHLDIKKGPKVFTPKPFLGKFVNFWWYMKYIWLDNICDYMMHFNFIKRIYRDDREKKIFCVGSKFRPAILRWLEHWRP